MNDIVLTEILFFACLFVHKQVKITPGTHRRSKISKTAFAMFLEEKQCKNQDENFIKTIIHDPAARNMPGKVKLSTLQTQHLKPNFPFMDLSPTYYVKIPLTIVFVRK